MKSTLIAIVLTVLVAGAFASELANARAQFEIFKHKYERRYSAEEHEHRFNIFSDNLKRIAALNKIDNGATYAMNHFADLTAQEFSDMYLNKHAPSIDHLPVAHPEPSNDVPTEWDWTTKGAVTPVKNQGQCGSCWSFSTTGNVEGIWFLAGHPLTSLSEQQLVDCDKVDEGCNGGLPSNAYQYIMQAGGIQTESSYPYEAVDDSCKFDHNKIAATISNWTAVSSDESDIASYLVAHGPLSIGINAEWMQFYSSGVSNPLFCDAKKLDHGVLIVGYGVANGTPFWKIKNSWGTTWGEAGYYRIIRGKGKCGLNTMVTSAIA